MSLTLSLTLQYYEIIINLTHYFQFKNKSYNIIKANLHIKLII
jgi:hypothetical protein